MNEKMYSICLFKFEDYRKFLELVTEEIKANLGLTYRELNDYFGFKASNFIQLVCKRERNLTAQSISSITQALQLDKDEKKYFSLLVDLNQNTSVTERQALLNKLIFLKKKNSKENLSKENYSYYSSWYNIVIREALQLKLTPNELETLENKIVPPISKSQKEEAIKSLEKLQLIKKIPDGYYPTELTLRTGDQFNHEMILQFHYKMLELAKESIHQFQTNEREIGAVTVSLSEKNFLHLKQKLKDLKEEILELSESEKEAERIYQINLQLFPLTKKIRGIK